MSRHLLRTACSVTTSVLMVGSLSGHQDRTPAPTIVRVVAERFSFSPSEISVDQGTRIELRITSEDTTHGFHLIGPGDINVEIPRRGRGEARVMIEIAEPGTYAFECSRLCGAGHGFMRGTLRIRSKAVKP
jgi:cytochrome c oxidase subunit 2